MHSLADPEDTSAEPTLLGTVLNIQRFTIHDGPGIRTEIFLKGCPLRCRWCSNPESYEKRQQVGVYATHCIGVDKCGYCLAACPQAGALVVSDNKVVAIDRKLCNDCQLCYEDCPSAALKQWGRKMTAEQVMERVCADRDFYRKSGGGITISGGEALLQWEFCLALLKLCRRERIHTCIETALHVNPDILLHILPYVDMIIADIKHMDSAVHRQQTGVPNEQILANLTTVVHSNTPTIVRIPVIPGFNDTQEAISNIGDFILGPLENRPRQVQLLRFRPMGEEKYASLGLPYPMAEMNPDRTEFELFIRSLVEGLTRRGIPAIAGTNLKVDLN